MCFTEPAETWYFQEKNWFSWQCGRGETRWHWCTTGWWKHKMHPSFIQVKVLFVSFVALFFLWCARNSLCYYYLACHGFCINWWIRVLYMLRSMGRNYECYSTQSELVCPALMLISNIFSSEFLCRTCKPFVATCHLSYPRGIEDN